MPVQLPADINDTSDPALHNASSQTTDKIIQSIRQLSETSYRSRKRRKSSREPATSCREDLSTVACLLSVNTTSTSTKATVPDGAPCQREAEAKNEQDNHAVHTDEDIARPKQRKQRRCFRYGNYSSYYGYRIGRALGDDPRLSVFERHWFEGRRCIDIGCNDGLITLSVAMRFLCSSIQGVDIDPSLIQKAQRSLGMVQQDLASSVRDQGTTVRNASTQGLIRQSENCPKATLAALHNVSFRHENFVEVDGCKEESVDMALW